MVDSLFSPTVLRWCAFVSQWSKLPFLVQAMTPLHYACFNGHPGVVRLLLGHGADTSLKDREVSFCLLHMCFYVLLVLTCTASSQYHATLQLYITLLCFLHTYVEHQDAAVSLLILAAM